MNFLHPFLHHYDIGFIIGTHFLSSSEPLEARGKKKRYRTKSYNKKKNHQEMYEVTKKFNLSKSRCLVSFFCFLGESQHKQKGTVEFERQSLEIVRMTSEGNSDPGDDFSKRYPLTDKPIIPKSFLPLNQIHHNKSFNFTNFC